MNQAVDTYINFLSLERRCSVHTVRAYRSDLEQFIAFAQEAGLNAWSEVDLTTIRLWQVSLMQAGAKASTVHRKLASLQGFWAFAMEQAWVMKDVMEGLIRPKKEKRLPQYMRESEMQALLDEFEFENNFSGMRDRLILEMLYGTGMRLSELIDLQVEQFTGVNEGIKVRGKRNKERLIPLHASLAHSCEAYLVKRQLEFPVSEAYFFLSDKGQKLYPKFVYRLVNMYLGKVSSRGKRSPHVLRHSFATHLLNRGADLNGVKELLGHANLAATQVYTHSSIEELKKVFNQAHPRGGQKN